MIEKKDLRILKLYKVEDNKVRRLKKICPRCGRFMAEHEDRYHCGYCGYREFKQNIERRCIKEIGIQI
ncbi:30S ribosomal protein S27ae [Candidatus Nanopusillus massiliensis]|uniref:30S ribosomal protein S27ae n=1 Tax=Candidatus Nanopusillus massiliensis TaxID=2897163 RepID=UPI001E2DFAB1|nr:30S ribosomal protein S27ae [Candidatus Nanopusillus massiliensis]